MILMDTVALDRDVAVRRTATAEPRPADHALRWLCCPSPNSISGPSNWVITLMIAGELDTAIDNAANKLRDGFVK